MRRGSVVRFLLVLVIEIDQHVAVHPVARQQDQHNEIGHQQRHIKRIGVIKPTKRSVEKMLANVVPNALGRGQ